MLPQEPDAGGDEAGAAAAAAEHQQRVAARLEALKAVQHGAAGGQPAADQGGCEGPQAAKEPADGDAAAAAQQARLRAQMQDISRALWSSVSAGNASGQGSWTSRSKADYAYNGEAIAAMKRGGELDDRWGGEGVGGRQAPAVRGSAACLPACLWRRAPTPFAVLLTAPLWPCHPRRHHRRRDAHTAHMEAQARDAALRRGAAAGSPAAK